MSWIDALKEWNGQNSNGKWCIPKKGTEGYNQVKAIMSRKKLKASDTPSKRHPMDNAMSIPYLRLLPDDMKKSMREKLAGFDTREYRTPPDGNVLGIDADYLLGGLDKFKRQETFWGKRYNDAVKYYNAVIKYAKDNTQETPNGKQYIKLTDYEKLFL